MKNPLKNKLIVITGFGRSGTTILGKVLGSMDNAVFAFEPPVMKTLSEFGVSNIPAKLLFETHFLPEIQGRGNQNCIDDSYTLNYLDDVLLYHICDKLRSRNDAERYLTDNNYKFVLKNTCLQYNMELIEQFFPGVKFVHIIRNGFDAIYSALSRGWFTDEHCNSDAVEDMIPHPKCDIFPYIDRESMLLWPDWNPATRAACAWRCAVTSGLRFKNANPDKCVQFKYEDFITKPLRYVLKFMHKFNLSCSDLTLKHINAINDFKQTPQIDNVYRYQIVEPERTKFINLIKKLKYKDANET